MKVGIGVSKEKEPETALHEAYRKSLQRMGATRSDLSLIFYSYDYTLDINLLATSCKKIFRDVPHMGSSTWGAWTNKDTFESETGLLVVSLKDISFEYDFVKVHSLREKAELWSAEVARQLGDRLVVKKTNPDFLFLMADSLNFVPGTGFNFLERHFPNTQITGFGTSFSVPQCSVVLNGEVFMNALVGMSITGIAPWIGLLQSVRPELNAIAVNRMSENLIIEMDGKPAFYKLCEHLMTQDDLPMMSPDEFRKYMGNLYIVEKSKALGPRLRSFGDPYRLVSLLGSEMTTGMVAVANALDFSQTHFLGQKKGHYAEEESHAILKKLKESIPNPSMIWMLSSASRGRERDRQVSDFEILQTYFPDTPIVGVSTNGEYLGGVNQYAALVVAFPQS